MSRRRRAGADGHAPLTDQVKMAVGPIGPDHADLLRWVRIFKHTYTNPLANRMATCGLRGPLSAVLGPCVDSCYCCIIPVWRTCHSRWNARMGLKMGGQLDDPPDSQEGESRSQRTTFGGATPLAKPVKTRGAARTGGGEPARRGGSGGAVGGGPAWTAMCLLQAAGTGLRGRRGPTRPARTHAAGAGLRGRRPGACQSHPVDSGRPFPPPSVCVLSPRPHPGRPGPPSSHLRGTLGCLSFTPLKRSLARHRIPYSCARAHASGPAGRRGPGGGGGTRSPQRRRRSGWRRAGADGDVLDAASGPARACTGLRAPTRPARAYAAGADPRDRRVAGAGPRGRRMWQRANAPSIAARVQLRAHAR